MSRRPDWKKHVTGQLEVPLMPELEAHLLSLPSSDDPDSETLPDACGEEHRRKPWTFTHVSARYGCGGH